MAVPSIYMWRRRPSENKEKQECSTNWKSTHLDNTVQINCDKMSPRLGISALILYAMIVIYYKLYVILNYKMSVSGNMRDESENYILADMPVYLVMRV